ncbi:MAG TPA: DUF1345 domain-containing protein [Flavisolibacter sp.]|nr:DUF1345 domain-containing protein [Flavisolibacter sp.]
METNKLLPLHFESCFRILKLIIDYIRGIYKVTKQDNMFKMTAVLRLIFCFTVAVVAFFILYHEGVEVFTRIVISWDIFGLLMIISIWRIFLSYNCDQVKDQAQIEDESRTIIFAIVLAAVIISLMGIIILLNNKTKGLIDPHIHAPVSIIGVGISWFLLHSIFTLRYAHIFYGNTTDENNICGGIVFPEENEPDYLDFAYFGFVIGMTFQVSDTNITLRRIRRLVLLHSLISFVYNTIIVAISISIIINLI